MVGATDRILRGDITFDHEGNPLLIKKPRPDQLPQVEDNIQIKQYFISESTLKKFNDEQTEKLAKEQAESFMVDPV